MSWISNVAPRASPRLRVVLTPLTGESIAQPVDRRRSLTLFLSSIIPPGRRLEAVADAATKRRPYVSSPTHSSTIESSSSGAAYIQTIDCRLKSIAPVADVINILSSTNAPSHMTSHIHPDRLSRLPPDDSGSHRRIAYDKPQSPRRHTGRVIRHSASPHHTRHSPSDDDRAGRKRPRSNSRSPGRLPTKRGRENSRHERHRRDPSLESKPRVPAGTRNRDKYRRSRDSRERERSESRDRKITRPRSRSRDRQPRGTSPSPNRSSKRPRSTSPDRHRHRRRRSRSRSRSRDRYRHRSRKHSSSLSPSRRHRHSPSRKLSPARSPVRRSGPLASQNAAFNAELDPSAPPPVEKQKPNFANTGLLAKEANKVTGTNISLKYHEPPEARKPPASAPWSLVIFKDSACIGTTELNARSCWLIGREAKVADILVEHPSCSGQHAAIQFRYREKAGGKGRVKPYVIDLESRNGTSVDGEKVEGGRYMELRSGDVIRFGESSREYVLMCAKT
ncbi:hypothetical protein EJ05DRAFT_511044 [Pseudovirgaria hyperparasitica]|uniref:FHA domain-containing protein n=1 Tax=Pseudovirgaria hyperparasitica TaxID=470096 RepID=A0A6A6W875_9PEZI|nr:uncharacterized protein EJ05DRAFT_511044 [Pseudovirgaria hyperparasitica]KAF2758224.1 hypothetical protein EJ05DRAFT_511044 [Pseudovirgaria hyperparasitica]